MPLTSLILPDRPMVFSPATYGLVRRIILAALTGNLPDEYRDESLILLSQALTAPDDDIRALAVLGLGELGARADMVLPALTGAMHDGNDQVRRRAARTIGDLECDALPSLQHLVAALDDPATTVRLEAMAAIGRIGPDAEPAIPHLIPLLADESTRVRTVAASTLKKIGPASIPHLVDALRDSDALIRERAALLLGQLRVGTDDVIAGLFEALTDDDDDVRDAAREALHLLETS